MLLWFTYKFSVPRSRDKLATGTENLIINISIWQLKAPVKSGIYKLNPLTKEFLLLLSTNTSFNPYYTKTRPHRYHVMTPHIWIAILDLSFSLCLNGLPFTIFNHLGVIIKMQLFSSESGADRTVIINNKSHYLFSTRSFPSHPIQTPSFSE